MRKIIISSDEGHSNPVSMQILLACVLNKKDSIVTKKDNLKKTNMTIKISDSRKISDIQQEFNDLFPFLKLEFFSRPHTKREGSEKLYRIDCSKKLSESRKVHTKGDLTIIPSQTVAELENAFEENYGLSVQVYRKSGKMWLQSTITDDWTLKEQNEHGEALSKFKAD